MKTTKAQNFTKLSAVAVASTQVQARFQAAVVFTLLYAQLWLLCR